MRNFLESEAQAVVPSPQDLGAPDAEGGVDHLGDRLAQRFLADVPSEHVAQIGGAFAVVAIGHPLEAGVGTQPVQAQ
jgi:hypothetical protein